MGLTVRDVLLLPILETAKVKSANNFLNEKLVEGITVIELPVENFVKKNEFVLSTGIGCEDDPILLAQFVEDIINSGASILAFATGRYIYEIPEQVLQLASNHNFIIIEIPWEQRFGDILRVVLQKINEDKQGERQQAEVVRNELINCVLHGKSLQDIANSIYKHIHIPVVIIDHQNIMRGYCYFDVKLLQIFQGERSGHLQLIPQSTIQYNENPLYHYMEEYMIDHQMCFQIAILNNEKNREACFFSRKRRKHNAI